MLVIRLQRTGRKGHAQFRVVVQDSRRTPTSGKVVAWIGSYDPHSKNVNLNKEKAQSYLDHGAQPTPRVARLLKAEGVKLPKWVEKVDKLKSAIKNPDKLRRNRPPEPKEEPAPAAELPVEDVAEKPEATGTDIAAETGESPNELASEEAEAAAETATDDSAATEQNS